MYASNFATKSTLNKESRVTLEYVTGNPSTFKASLRANTINGHDGLSL